MKKLGWTAVPTPTVPQHVIEETAFELADKLENDLANGAGNNSVQRLVGDHWIVVTNSGGTLKVDVWKQVMFGQIDEVESRQEEI